MKELKCPKCGTMFSVDEADYETILSQVKNTEFQKELNQRILEVERKHEAERKAEAVAAEMKKQQELQAQQKLAAEQEMRISQLMEQLKTTEQNQNNAVELALLKQKTELDGELQKKILEIERLKGEASVSEQKAANDKQSLIDQYEERLRQEKENNKKELQMKDDQIAQYKDFKTRLSTKMIGESLEVYCSNQYEMMVRPYMQNAEFGKDNNVVEGTKGDFVFRDVVDEVESVSIMFEMKNEADETATKHKNADFFDKLDKDRKRKNCEYAVLVSMLELDNELYNNGIYAVPNYEKMFVVRPQQFLTIISILVQTGRNTLKMKQELKEARDMEVDITNFETKLDKFKKEFVGHYEKASSKYHKAIEEIDNSIKKMQAVKEALLSTENYIRLADKDIDALTIRKLTYMNPTMKSRFDEARETETVEIKE